MKNINLTIVICLMAVFSASGQDDWTTIDLTTFKMGMGSTYVGSNIYFGGGITSGGVTDEVEIYNLEAKEWSYRNLSVARNFPAVVSGGGQVFFAGGMDPEGTVFNTIDILDTLSQQWSTAQRSFAGFYLSAVSKENIVVFAGGIDFIQNTESDIVDIYNTDTKQWATEFLSQPRGAMGSAVIGDFAFFGGGLLLSSQTVTDMVDIYNFSTGEWTTNRLSEARFGITATTIGDKIFFAGGERADGTLSKRIDIYDHATKSWAIDSLSVARSFTGAATVCGKAYFAGGMKFNFQTGQVVIDFDEIDIYDDATGIWTVELLPYNLFWHSTLSTGDQLFIAGGGTISGNFIQLRKEVRILTCNTVGTDEWTSGAEVFSVYPNPTLGNFYITLVDKADRARITISDLAGAIVYRSTTIGSGEVEVNTNDFVEGVYIVRIQVDDRTAVQKIVVLK